MPPNTGSRAAGKQHASSGSLRDPRTCRLSPLVALYEIAQDNFRKLDNQLFETRNLLLAALQLALFVCHRRCFTASPPCIRIHVEPLSAKGSNYCVPQTPFRPRIAHAFRQSRLFEPSQGIDVSGEIEAVMNVPVALADAHTRQKMYDARSAVEIEVREGIFAPDEIDDGCAGREREEGAP